MSIKIKSMLASAALFAAVVSASAQPRGEKPERSPEERAKFMVEKMTEKLDLTEQQQQQILDLHKEMTPRRGERPERPERQEMKKGEKPSKEEMENRKEERELKMEEHRAAMKAKMDEHKSKMEAILTPEQFAKWQEEMKNMPQRRHRPEARRNDDKRDNRGPRDQHRHHHSKESKNTEVSKS